MSVSRLDEDQTLDLQGLRVARTRRGDDDVIHVHGELDLANAGALHGELLRIEQDGYRGLVFDLRGLQFLDSTGIHVLAEAHRRATGRGAKVSIAVADGAVRRVLQVSGMLDVLTPCELDAEAA